jgi:hypothetical protein
MAAPQLLGQIEPGDCWFHAFLGEYSLAAAVLHRIARIIDEADTVQEVHVEPAAPCLDLLGEGIHRSQAICHSPKNNE